MAGEEKQESELKESIIQIRDFIGSHLRMIYSDNIVNIVKKSGLGKYVPANLNKWGNSDFAYEENVYQLLVDVIEKEDVDSLEVFFQNIINEVSLFQTCKKYEKGCPVPKLNRYDSAVCTGCSEYLDNKAISIFNKSIRVFGLFVDKDGYVKRISGVQLDIASDIKKIKESAPSEMVDKLLTEDVQKKGQQMTSVYMYLYNIENCIRKFIENVCIQKVGPDYDTKITIPTEIQTHVDSRKDQESKKKWLPVRTDSIFYYMDFDDLRRIIVNNWDLFKEYFLTTESISSKLNELYDCRNRIAHNSYIDESNKELIHSYFIQILKQIT
jgi:hypothetical protein